MKTIKGKIEFGVVPKDSLKISGINPIDGLEIELLDTYECVTEHIAFNGMSVRLSMVTEEQAAEFVDFDNDDRYKDYLIHTPCYQLKTAKESLISLLKANDILLEYGVSGFDGHNEYDKIEKQDYILIKLT